MKKLIFLLLFTLGITGCQTNYDISKLPMQVDASLDKVTYIDGSNKNTNNIGMSSYVLFTEQSTAQLNFKYKTPIVINDKTETIALINDFRKSDPDGTSQEKLVDRYGSLVKKFFNDDSMHAYLIIIQSTIPYTSKDVKDQLMDAIFKGKLDPDTAMLFLISGPVMTKNKAK